MRKIAYAFLCFILLLSVLPLHSKKTAQAQSSEQLVVHASVLKLREGPGLSYPVVLKLNDGDHLKMLEAKGEWYKVEAKGKVGWVASWLTRTVKTSNTEATVRASVLSNVDRLNLRLEPSLSSTVLSQLQRGQTALYIKETNNWVQVEYENQIGWVSKQYVTIVSGETNNTTTTSEVSDSQQVTDKLFTVNVSAVNIRQKPSLNAKKVGTIKLNEQYEVLGRSDNWVQIEYVKGKKGWVYSFYGTFKNAVTSKTKEKLGAITIMYDRTNLREQPSTNAKVVARANAGESYTILSLENDWYKISLKTGQEAYVANRVVQSGNDKKSSTTSKTTRKKGTLNGVTIVIDPGHGGNDHGTTGVQGASEKSVNLLTADLLKSKLRAAGAEVVMTRESDKYVDLRKRVSISNQQQADAFISIHYDASNLPSVNGFTTYYTNANQKKLAEAIHSGLSSKVTLNNRGVQPGNYLVLRENRQPAVLLELGFLSNRSEERTITTDYYREQASQGIYNGLIKYFDNQLK